jgi:phage protein D
MIIKTNSGLSPDVVITISGVEVDYAAINKITLSLDENKHDICTISIAGLAPKSITDYIDAPVRVFISTGPGREQEFCGYVVYVEPGSNSQAGLVNNSPFQVSNVVCLGTSVSMKGSKNKVWESTSLPIIAQTLAYNYGYSLDVYKDTFEFPRLVQSSESDWAFLLKVCEMYGMRVTVHGTHMHIWDPFKALGRLSSFNKLYTSRSTLDNVPGSILKFTGTFGYLSPEGMSTNFKTASLDRYGTIVEVTSASQKDHSWSGNGHSSKFMNEINTTTQTVEEASRKMKEYNRKYFAFNASVQIVGGSGVVPGGVVEVRDYNSNFDGYWYVHSVQHTIGGSQYLTDLKIARDYNTVDEYVIPTVSTVNSPPDPVLINNSWRTSRSMVTLYV